MLTLRLLCRSVRRSVTRIVILGGGFASINAAKRLRYTAEALEPAAGKPARRLRKAAKQVTTALGARQDTVVAREQLVRLAALAREDGESDFTYGLLVGQEQARAAEAERDALGARGRVEKRRDDWG